MISIIIPCYNHAKYLRECINSILAQTEHDYEVIFIDDASTDESVEIMSDALGLFKRAFILRMYENSGPGKARNTGIDFAEGEYIMPVDSDNKMHPRCLEKMLDVVKQGYIAYSDTQEFSEKGLGTLRRRAEYSFNELQDHNFIENMSMYRRVWWQDIGGYDENRELLTYEDWDLWIRMGQMGIYGKRIPEPLTYYRVVPGSRNDVGSKHHNALVAYMRSKYVS